MPDKTLADILYSETFAGAPPTMRKYLNGAGVKTIEGNLIALRQELRAARRFTLNDEFVREVVRKANCHGSETYARSNFAQLPFETVWIEYNIRERLKRQFEQGTNKSGPENYHWHAGWLMQRAVKENPHIWSALPVYGEEGPKRRALINHMIYHFRLPPSGEKFDGWDSLPIIEKVPSIVLWGYSDPTQAQFSAPPQLAGIARVCIEPYVARIIFTSPKLTKQEKLKLDGIYQLNSREFAGDLRFLITAMSMINLVPTEYKTIEPSGTYKARLKTLPYLDTQEVKILAGKAHITRVVDRAMLNADPKHMRRHEVRGHWRVLHHGEQSERRIWIREHERGDESLGRIKQTFRVGVAHDQPPAQSGSTT